VQRLKTHFARYERMGMVEIWDETHIAPGALWQEEIKHAISHTNVALLLVSADYLASRAITENELPPLLHAAQTEGATILPVIVSACAFADSELARLQTVNRPDRPLSGLRWESMGNRCKDGQQRYHCASRTCHARAGSPSSHRTKKALSRRRRGRSNLSLNSLRAWEYLLTAELLYSRLLPIRQRLTDIHSAAVYQKSPMMRGDLFFIWAQEKDAAFSSLLTYAATILSRDLPAARGPAGVAGDPLAIKRAVEKLIYACNEMLEHEVAIRFVLVPDPFTTLKRTMQGWSAAFIYELGDIPARLTAPSVPADICPVREPAEMRRRKSRPE
jgi:hypothetical protein